MMKYSGYHVIYNAIKDTVKLYYEDGLVETENGLDNIYDLVSEYVEWEEIRYEGTPWPGESKYYVMEC